MNWRAAAAAMLLAAVLTGCSSKSTTHGRGTHSRHAAAADPVLVGLGLPPVHGSSPLPRYLMIADRDNDRIIIVSPDKRIVWRFPRPGDLRPGQRFAGPDDAFVSADHKSIITNEEFSDAIAVVSLSRRGRIVWEYGHQQVPGTGPGYLAHPDDAYLLSNRQIQVADLINCRVLWLDQAKKVVHSIGTAGDCAHDPPGMPCSSRTATPHCPTAECW